MYVFSTTTTTTAYRTGDVRAPPGFALRIACVRRARVTRGVRALVACDALCSGAAKLPSAANCIETCSHPRTLPHVSTTARSHCWPC